MLPPSTAYSPTPIRATTPIYEVKETRLQLFLYPPSPTLPLFVSRSFLHGFPRCHHPVHPSSHPPLLRISLELNLFLRHSVCHAILMNDKFMELTRNQAEFVCISEKKYTYTRTRIVRHECYTEIVAIACLQRSHRFARMILFAGDSQARS